jgi:hypothetical protein
MRTIGHIGYEPDINRSIRSKEKVRALCGKKVRALQDHTLPVCHECVDRLLEIANR